MPRKRAPAARASRGSMFRSLEAMTRSLHGSGQILRRPQRPALRRDRYDAPSCASMALEISSEPGSTLLSHAFTG